MQLWVECGKMILDHNITLAQEKSKAHKIEVALPDVKLVHTKLPAEIKSLQQAVGEYQPPQARMPKRGNAT